MPVKKFPAMLSIMGPPQSPRERKKHEKELNKILYEVKEKYIGADPIDIFGNPIKK